MKNSSRLLAEIDRKRSRSSSGWLGLAASSSTRSLKASQEVSRLKNRLGEAISSSLRASWGAREAGTSSPRVSSWIAASVMVRFSRASVTAASGRGENREAPGRRNGRPGCVGYWTMVFGAVPAGQSPRRLASMVIFISAMAGGTLGPVVLVVMSTL